MSLKRLEQPKLLWDFFFTTIFCKATLLRVLQLLINRCAIQLQIEFGGWSPQKLLESMLPSSSSNIQPIEQGVQISGLSNVLPPITLHTGRSKLASVVSFGAAGSAGPKRSSWNVVLKNWPDEGTLVINMITCNLFIGGEFFLWRLQLQLHFWILTWIDSPEL